MAAADTAKLVASLTLDAKGFTQGADKVQSRLKGLESGLGNIGRKAGQGVATFTRNVGLIGVAATGAIAVAVKGGLQDLATLESAITSVDGAIETMGQTGQITGKQVADWANEIEANIGAAFDDKAITQAAATLIRFGKLTPKNLRKALEVTTDLAVRTGDVESASELLAKALADPASAFGKLARQGIILTKAQQDTIKEMLKQNDVAGAQALILAEVEKTTKGAAEASQGKYQRALSVLNDVAEDARKALAEGFLPVLERVAEMLSTKLADPAFMQGLRDFGVTLAGGLDDLISVAEKLPWSTIGESLKIAGAGAKAVLEAFTSLPPWVQTAVITGWGLNKLTGGMLGSITKDLASGLIKGVLGINAGHVTVNAKTVAGVGGGGAGAGTAAKPGKLATVASAVGKVFIVGAAAAFIHELVQVRNQQSEENKQQAAGVVQQSEFFANSATLEDMKKSLEGLREKQAKLTNDLTPEAIAYQLDIDGVKTTLETAIKNVEDGIRNYDQHSQASAFQIRDAVNQKMTFLGSITSQVRDAVAGTTAAARAAGQQAAFAIRDKDLSVSVANTIVNDVTVSVRETIKTTTTHKQYARYVS